MKDFDPAVWGTKPRRYLLPGEGTLDIDGFLDRLPYDGTLTLEMSAVGANGEIDADRLEAADAWLRRLVPMSRRVAILGCGKIGESLLAGLLSAGWRESSEVVASCRRDERAGELRGHYGIQATLSNGEAAAGAGLVVVAVKPQDIESLLGEIGPQLSPEQTVLSVAAAIRTARIESRIAAGVPVVRAMPNAPSIVHEGIAGICAGAHAREENLALAEECLSHLGRGRARSGAVHGRGHGRLRLRPGVLRARSPRR